MMVLLAIEILFFVVPLYLSNSMPVIFGGKPQIDFGKKFFDGRPLFGAGKTYRGFLAGILIGWAGVLAAQYLVPMVADFDIPQSLYFGLFVATGALLGDLFGSFIKRRIGLPQGAPVFLLDQLDFVAGGLALGSFFYVPSLYGIIFIAFATVIMHRFTNIIAYKLKLKKVPW